MWGGNDPRCSIPASNSDSRTDKSTGRSQDTQAANNRMFLSPFHTISQRAWVRQIRAVGRSPTVIPQSLYTKRTFSLQLQSELHSYIHLTAGKLNNGKILFQPQSRRFVLAGLLNASQGCSCIVLLVFPSPWAYSLLSLSRLLATAQ